MPERTYSRESEIDATRASARLPGLDIDIIHRQSPNGDWEQMSINLRATSSAAGGLHLQGGNVPKPSVRHDDRAGRGNLASAVDDLLRRGYRSKSPNGCHWKRAIVARRRRSEQADTMIAVHGFWVARPVYGSDEGGAAPGGAGHTHYR